MSNLSDLDTDILALAGGDTTEEERGSPTDTKERLGRRVKRSGLTDRNDEYADDVPSGPLSPTPSEDARSVRLLLDAAKLLEQNVIPCTQPDCPVKHPHGERVYLFEGRVPNSELANVYFAPSRPPPSVVEAYNNLDGLPSWQDLDMKDRFFEYHTAPCRPSKHLDKVGKLRCKSEHCGVRLQPHQKGVYLHDGIDASLHMSRRLNHAFGISNPPPEVWQSAIQVQNGTGTELDEMRVDDFSVHHTRWDANDIRHYELSSWIKERRYQRP